MSKNTLNTLFISGAKQEFEWRCMSLFVDAYVFTKSNHLVDINCEEEYISAVLCDYIDNKSSQAINWYIRIATEYRLHNEDVLKKKKSAKEAPRIDFVFFGWAEKLKLTYFAEAKNLIETDVPKKGRKSKISATYLHKRYVETGIDNYVSGKYPSNGCLVGYILQGKTENIIHCLNKHLCDSNRMLETLKQQSFGLENLDSCYLSTHNDVFLIKHLMFDFT